MHSGVYGNNSNLWFQIPHVRESLRKSTIHTMLLHDGVIKWKHSPRHWPFVQGIHRWPVNFQHKGRWGGALVFSLICVWINGWVNIRDAGHLRRYRAHYDVIGMWCIFLWCRHITSYESVKCIHSCFFNRLRPRLYGCHFADDSFKCIFLNEHVWISIQISLKFVPKDQIDNISALVKIMTWSRTGDKPLSEPMMVRLPTHIFVTPPQWFRVG